MALGADAFFNEFHRMAESDQLRQQLEAIMTALVSDALSAPATAAGTPGRVTNPFATQAPQAQAQLAATVNQSQSSVMDQVPTRE